MKAKLKHKFSTEWITCYTLVFELYNGGLYMYQDEEALKQKEITDDCIIEIESNGEFYRFNVVDGRVQKV